MGGWHPMTWHQAEAVSGEPVHLWKRTLKGQAQLRGLHLLLACQYGDLVRQ